MDQFWQAFVLGNQAILTNVCMLPLYPGLIAFLAGNTGNAAAQRAGRWLGLLVLAGILVMMLAVGLILTLLRQSFGGLLPVLLPVIYAVVIVLGLLLLLGRSPFARMAQIQAPVLRNPYASAFVYGLLLGPMTLPCTGPLITSAFAVGAANPAQLGEGLLFFLWFGLGFGWPLVVLPWLTGPLQRRFTGWMTRNHRVLEAVSGILLVGIGIFGLVTEVLPNVA